jgi:hypothetical protein
MKKIKIVCAECGSGDVTFDALVAWSFIKQKFEVITTYDYCNICDGEVKTKEVLVYIPTKIGG